MTPWLLLNCWIFGITVAAQQRGSWEPLASGEPPLGLRLHLRGDVCLDFVHIPADESPGGRPAGEVARDTDKPRHTLRLASGFYLGKFQVTQAQWRAVMGGQSCAIYRGRGGRSGRTRQLGRLPAFSDGTQPRIPAADGRGVGVCRPGRADADRRRRCRASEAYLRRPGHDGRFCRHRVRLPDVPHSAIRRHGEALDRASGEEAYERCQLLRELQRRADKLRAAGEERASDDGSDRRYQLDDQLRELTRDFHRLESGMRFAELESRLEETLDRAESIANEDGSDLDQRRLADARQQAFSARKKRAESDLKANIEEIDGIRWNILFRTPGFLMQMFEDLSQNRYSQFNNTEMADAYIQTGRQAIANQDWMRLRDVDFGLVRLLPDRQYREYCELKGIRVRDD